MYEENLKRENEKLSAQVNDLNATILKFTYGQKSFDQLLGPQKQIIQEHGIGFAKSSEANC